LKRSLWILIFSSFLLRISAICWSCFCSFFSDFSCKRWRTSTAVLDDDVYVKLFDLRLFALSLPSGRDVSIFSFPDSAWPATVRPWVGDDIPSSDVELFSSRNLLFHLASLQSFFPAMHDGKRFCPLVHYLLYKVIKFNKNSNTLLAN
jgi:hypothetical protein